MRLMVVLLLVAGCRDAPQAPRNEPAPAPAAPLVWPPDGEKAPAPPAVQELMRRMVNALDGGDEGVARDLFMNDVQLSGVIVCPGQDVAGLTLAARDRIVDRAKDLRGKLLFKGLADGTSTRIRRGESAGGCTAKVDVEVFRARYDLEVGGTAESGEAHFLQVGHAWFFTRL